MSIKKLFGGKALAVALACAMVPASIAIPQSAPVVGSIIGAGEAQAQYYGGRPNYRGGRNHYRAPRYQPPRHHYRSNRRSNSGAVIGGAIAGLAAGAIIAGAANSQPRYVQQAPVYQSRPQPWTQDWYQYCSQRYRSFDPRSGTFQPYNGPRRLCQ